MMLGLIDADVQIFWAAAGSESVEEAVEKLHDVMEETMEGSFADEFKIACKGKGNYRKDFYPNYKANREKNPLADDLKVRLKACHKEMVSYFKATMAHGQEADDLVRIWAEEARQQSRRFVVIAEDKDLKCIAGAHYNPKKSLHEYWSEDQSDLFYHNQLLAGDPTDNIKGLWRVGMKNKFLVDVPMGERFDKVVEVYKEKEGDAWYEKLMETGTLIHIKKTHDDFFYVPGVTKDAST